MREYLIGWVLRLFAGNKSYFCALNGSAWGLYKNGDSEDLDFLEDSLVKAVKKIQILRELGKYESFSIKEIEIKEEKGDERRLDYGE
ncbi:MAG: hypothetical protein ACTTH5_00105 [Wolinella sp.]